MSHLSHTQRLTRLALLTAIALIIFIIEAQIPPLVAIPGVKMGLANIITLVTLYSFGRRDALMVLLVRIVLGSIFSGQMMTLLFSLSGGLCSWHRGCVLVSARAAAQRSHQRLFHRSRCWRRAEPSPTHPLAALLKYERS